MTKVGSNGSREQDGERREEEEGEVEGREGERRDSLHSLTKKHLLGLSKSLEVRDNPLSVGESFP